MTFIQEIQSERMKYAKEQLTNLGIQFESKGKEIRFNYLGSQILFYPYTGWHTGKTIKDGRGIKNLLKQIKQC